jgi:replicative DNA helicase
MTEIADRPTATRTRERAAAYEEGRQPPQDLAAEQSVLGAMLLSKDAVADVLERLAPDDFYRPAHQLIYDTVLDLFGRGEPADAVTVAAELDRRGQLVRIGHAPYLHTLIATVPTAASAGYYAAIVAEKATLRRLVQAGTRVVQYGYAGAEGADVADVVDRAQAEMYDVTHKRSSDDMVALEDLLQPTMDEIETIGAQGGIARGIPTGFPDLDAITNGLHPGQLVVVAARPGVGKALAIDTVLPTPDGWTTMAAVSPGDFLLDAKGDPTRVVAATEIMTGRPCFELAFADGSSIVADGEHQWPTSAGVRTTAQLWRTVAHSGAPVALVTSAQLVSTTDGPTHHRAPHDSRDDVLRGDNSAAESVAVRSATTAALTGTRASMWRTVGAHRHAITAIQPVPAVPVRCVQVDNPDHLYLAGAAHIPTHNSTLALDFLRSCSIRHQLPSVMFSLEMSKSEIVMRLLSAEASVKLASMRSGRMSDDDWMKVGKCMGGISDAPLYIDDSPNLTMMEIRAKARRLRQKCDLRMIVVDYMQLMTSGKRYESRQQEVSDFSRNLKLMAKELEVPVVALSQLNRGPEQRMDKKPQLSDLRESGSIEQDCDIAILLHRPDAFDRDDPRGGEADLILGKHRNGPTGVVNLSHQLHLSRFSPMPHMGHR